MSLLSMGPHTLKVEEWSEGWDIALVIQDRRLAIVTSSFHMPRTQGIFDHIFALGGKHLHSDSNW